MKLGAGILYTNGHKVLLLHRSAKVKSYSFTWAPTGGSIEDGENFLQAAERESKEEIGVLKGSKIAEFVNDPFIMFIFKVDEPFKVQLNDEHTKSKWISLDKVIEYKLHPNFKKKWHKYLHAIEKNNHKFSEWLKRSKS